MTWENLSKSEQEEWNKKAEEINKLGLGLFTKTIADLLEKGVLIFKDNKIRIDGNYAFKLFQEKGIPPELLVAGLNKKLKALIP